MEDFEDELEQPGWFGRAWDKIDKALDRFIDLYEQHPMWMFIYPGIFTVAGPQLMQLINYFGGYGLTSILEWVWFVCAIVVIIPFAAVTFGGPYVYIDDNWPSEWNERWKWIPRIPFIITHLFLVASGIYYLVEVSP